MVMWLTSGKGAPDLITRPVVRVSDWGYCEGSVEMAVGSTELLVAARMGFLVNEQWQFDWRRAAVRFSFVQWLDRAALSYWVDEAPVVDSGDKGLVRQSLKAWVEGWSWRCGCCLVGFWFDGSVEAGPGSTVVWVELLLGGGSASCGAG